MSNLEKQVAISAIDLETVSKEDLAAMIVAKTNELAQSELALAKSQKETSDAISEKTRTEARAMKVYEKNRMNELSPTTAGQLAEMEVFLKMAEKFTKSGAFPKFTPEQAYTIIQAGREMNMQPVESLQAMYIVNGTVKFYGDKMAARILHHGFRLQYRDETPNGVKVRCFHPDPSVGFDVTEVVTDKDQILQRSKAIGFAKKNKMRFHGIRMIASFHLPHLFGSTADEFTSDFNAEPSVVDIEKVNFNKEKTRLLAAIEKADTVEKLEVLQPHINKYEVETEYNNRLEDLKNKK